MSTDALRAALEALLDAHARNTLFSGAGHWEQARAALAQPVSAEPVAPIANVKVFGCYDAAQVPLDVRGVYQLDGFTTGVYVDMPSGACAPIAPPPTSAERVPLTDEQIDAIPLIGVALPKRFHETLALNAALRQFARAIERAHGIAC